MMDATIEQTFLIKVVYLLLNPVSRFPQSGGSQGLLYMCPTRYLI